jgi:enediyne polyketide synthase
MAAKGDVKGAMATVAASPGDIELLLKEVPGYVIVAGYNTPNQAIVSGEAEAVRKFIARCRENGIAAISLKVSNAFHSHLVSSASAMVGEALGAVEFVPARHAVISTVTGREFDGTNVREILRKQILHPVRFMDAVKEAGKFGVNVFVEVGPGRSLGSMVGEIDKSAAILYTDDDGGTSFRSFNISLGCLFALGVPVRTGKLYESRFTRPLSLDYQPGFLRSPCESTSLITDGTPSINDMVSAGESPAGPADQVVAIRETREEKQEFIGGDPGSILNLVLDLAAGITEYPRESVKPEHLLLRDLNLNSIASAQLVAEAARRLGLSRPSDATEYSTASLQQIANSLHELSSTRGAGDQPLREKAPAGIEDWVRSFTVEMKEELLSRTHVQHLKDGDHCVLISEGDHPVATSLLERLIAQGVDVEVCNASLSGEQFEEVFAPGRAIDAVVMVLPQGADAEAWDLDDISPRIGRLVQPLFNAGKYFSRWYSVRGRRQERDVLFGIIQFGGGMFGRAGLAQKNIDLACGSGYVKSLFLESSFSAGCVVDLSSEIVPAAAANLALVEFQRADGFVEVGYTSDGARRIPVMKLIQDDPAQHAVLSHPGLSAEDVLLVTGGGRGIAAHSALAIARAAGCKVALLGRTKRESAGDEGSELAATLGRFNAAGIVHAYFSCDVADAAALSSTTVEVEKLFGPITAVLHAAGNNIPQATRNLSWEVVEKTIAPKARGTINLLRTIGRDRIKTFITFGSIIGQTGMRGEAAYAFANEWMNLVLLQAQLRFPGIRFLSLNWSVWSGGGMGERLGSVDALLREGITPIAMDQGIEELGSLMRRKPSTPEILITGRLGDLPTRIFAEEPLPLFRFSESRRVYYQGIELICDSNLSSDTDPYLRDHRYPSKGGFAEGMQLLPAVVGVEAMVQLASVLAKGAPVCQIEDLQLKRPVMVPPGGSTTVRVIAQVRRGGRIEVALRTAETNFSVDHFRGTCILSPEAVVDRSDVGEIPGNRLPVDPATELYGGILWQGPMFQHLTGYRELTATSCIAEIDCPPPAALFGRYLPQPVLTGNPAVRDVFLHAIQPCVPQKSILPLSIGKIRFVRPLTEFPGLIMRAVERERIHNEYTYDVVVRSTEGELVELIEGFRCRAVGETVGLHARLPVPLLAPYLERHLQGLFSELHSSVAIDFGPSDQEAQDENPGLGRSLRRRNSSTKAVTTAVRNLVWQATKKSGCDNSFELVYRDDGKPEVEFCPEFRSLNAHVHVSASHSNQTTLALASAGPCACDVEAVNNRSDQTWNDLIGADGMLLAELIRKETEESTDASRTRVWTMNECAKKAGFSRFARPALEPAQTGGWTIALIRENGRESRIATFRSGVRPDAEEAVYALLVTPVVQSAVGNTIIQSQR